MTVELADGRLVMLLQVAAALRIANPSWNHTVGLSGQITSKPVAP